MSDDGEKFIYVLDLIGPDLVDKIPVMKLWIRGALARSIYLRDVMDIKKLVPVPGGEDYDWVADVVGFSTDHKFVLRLRDGNEYEIHF